MTAEQTAPPGFTREPHRQKKADANGAADGGADAPFTEDGTAPRLPSLADLLGPAVDRAQRRAEGQEKPIPLPWPSLADHFGGGLWPGVHFITAGTGIGKTALSLQLGMHAARAGVPVAYVGLELDDLQLALRLLGESAGVPWSTLYLGKAGPEYLSRARAAIPALAALPFFPFVQRPQGWSASTFATMAEGMRTQYPETDGPGSKPLLFILDFLQIIGDETGPDGEPMNLDTRTRISRASYAMRDIAIRFDAAVLPISSVARDKYGALLDACMAAKLECDNDEAGRPIKRRILNPDAIVGLGKESGEIEYAADSVSVLAKVPATWKDGAVDVLFATAKGRATGAMWSAMHFTRWGYREADDGGSFTWAAIQAAAEERGAKREAKAKAKDDARAAKIVADAATVASYVLIHPNCPTTEAKVNAVADNPRRWRPAVAKLAASLVETVEGKCKRLRVDRARLPAEVAALVTSDGTHRTSDAPPHTPPPSASDVDGRGPTSDSGQDRTSDVSDVSDEGTGS